jgi:hypothetical protein
MVLIQYVGLGPIEVNIITNFIIQRYLAVNYGYPQKNIPPLGIVPYCYLKTRFMLGYHERYIVTATSQMNNCYTINILLYAILTV